MAKKILIVDDDRSLCEEMAEILREEGYVVDSAFDPRRGMDLIKTHVYDLCLLDYKMPDLTGIDLLREAKEKNPQTAVLIVSGRPFIEKLIEKEKATGLVSGTVQKPFEIETLLRKIRDLI